VHRILGTAGVAILLALLLAAATASASEPIAAVAVFPVENLTGGSAPDDVRRFLAERLASAGVRVLEDAALEAFMARHRLRSAAGVDAATAESLRNETGVDGVVIASVELSSQAVPPKVALIVRLVSIAAVPVVVWADDVGMAGDDAPGWFELGVVNDHEKLLTKALNRLSDSMLAYLKTGVMGAAPKRDSTFRPRTSYRSSIVEPTKNYSVAILPFVNLSARRNAGEILALLFTRHLTASPRFRVADTGVVRQQLLDARIIMEGGLSISDAETVAALVDADLVLAGRVLRYEDYEEGGGRVRVEFSTVLIDRRTRRVVWSSDSYNDGTDGAGWFERGTVRTAHAMAAQMVGLTTEMIVGRTRRP
jgi:TolB-like protein